MNKNELIADNIEEVIGRLFTAFSQHSPTISEYSIYYDPKKYSSWFVELFFLDHSQLNETIQNGTCYGIHSFLLREFEHLVELKDVPIAIHFEFGNRPATEKEYHEHHSKLIEKTKRLAESNTDKDASLCKNCGHNFDQHQLKGHLTNETTTPMKGWITCPEENCTCFLTWDANYNGVE